MSEKVGVGFNKKLTTVALLLNVETAFDTVWLTGAIYNLIELNFLHHLIRLISNFLIGRRFSVCISNEFTEVKTIVTGVPQGSVLAPLLYSLFLYDILFNSRSKLTMFDDDTSLSLTNCHKTIIALQLLCKHSDNQNLIEEYIICLNIITKYCSSQDAYNSLQREKFGCGLTLSCGRHRLLKFKNPKKQIYWLIFPFFSLKLTKITFSYIFLMVQTLLAQFELFLHNIIVL